MDYLHYGTMFSYYSAKTRAVMSFKRIPFVEVYDPRELSGRIQEATSKRMIPVLVAPDGEILQDTTVIVDALEARFPDRPVFPADSAMMLLSRIAEFFIDELWITTAMNTRWNDPVSKAFAIGEFGRGIGEAHGLEGEAAMAIGQRVADQMQSYLPYLGIGTEDGQRIASQFFRTATLKLNNVVGKDRYALGSRPWLIDFVLFEGYYAHHYRDAGAAQQFLKQEAPQLCYYLDALHAGHCIAPEGEPGISDALVDYLSYVGPSAAAFGAALELQAGLLAAQSAPGRVFEKGIDPVTFDLGGESFSRGGSTFGVWKLQRVRAAYQQMDEEAQQAIAPVLTQIGWADVLAADPGFRLERKNHLTHLA